MRSLVEAGVRIRARQDAVPLAKASAATVTRNGRITIPARVRRALHLAAGDRVEFVETAPGCFEFIAANRSVTELKGLFGKPARIVTIGDMNLAIAKCGEPDRD